MTDLIRRISERLRAVFAPGSGKHRAGTRPAPVRRPATPVSRPVTARSATPWPPAPRSLYGCPEALDGTAHAVVRPYLVAHEQRQEQALQRHRRLALVLAADFGIDLDTHLIGARGAA